MTFTRKIRSEGEGLQLGRLPISRFHFPSNLVDRRQLGGLPTVCFRMSKAQSGLAI